MLLDLELLLLRDAAGKKDDRNAELGIGDTDLIGRPIKLEVSAKP